jgi:hypothetical protein
MRRGGSGRRTFLGVQDTRKQRKRRSKRVLEKKT